MDIDHLDGGELLERAARGEPGREDVPAAGQGDVQAAGEGGDEEAGFDPLLVLLEDGTDRQAALEVAERLLDGDELDVVLPDQGRDRCR